MPTETVDNPTGPTFMDAFNTASSEMADPTPTEGDYGDNVSDAVTDPEPETFTDETVETDGDTGEPGGEAMFTVTVDGAPVEVTLSELQNGYLRQADYTRKTQDIAETRRTADAYQQLEAALQQNPAEVLAALAESYGVPTNQASEPAFDPDDPMEAALADLRSKVEQQNRWQEEMVMERRVQAIENELSQLASTYNDPDLNQEELLQFALDNKIGSLDAAYRAYKFVAPTLSQAPAGQAAPSRDEQATNAKRNLPPIEGGTNRTQTGVDAGPAERMTLRQAFNLSRGART